jgi:hypothetical protein
MPTGLLAIVEELHAGDLSTGKRPDCQVSRLDRHTAGASNLALADDRSTWSPASINSSTSASIALKAESHSRQPCRTPSCPLQRKAVRDWETSQTMSSA